MNYETKRTHYRVRCQAKSEVFYLLTNQEFAAKLKEARESMGFKQKQFAAKFNIDSDSLKNWEQGRCKPSTVENIGKLINAFGDRADFIYAAMGVEMPEARSQDIARKKQA